MKIFDIIMGRRKVRDAYTDGNGFVSRWARPPSMNTAEWLEMFSKSPRLSVVEKIATDLASLSGHLYRVNPDGSETEITKHPFLDFMAHPNPLYEMTSAAMWRLNEIYLMLVGESFFLIERDENDRPVELWNVPPHWVKMTPYLGNPGYLITSPTGLTMTVPVEDMFVMKHLNPLDPFMRGLGVAESIADEIEIDEFSAQFQKRFFYNDGTPSLVFLMPDATENQRDAFMARWNKRHRGVENSHKAAALTGNVDIKTFGSKDIRELGFVESRIAIRDAVLEHFGMPREIMGITENSNRSTADSAQYIYAKNVLTPRINDRAEAINQQLLPLFGDNLVWRFDPVVPYDKEFDKERALDGWNAGLLTKNEARELMDLPEVSGGNVFKVGINDLFMEQTADPAEVTQALAESHSEKKAERCVNVGAMLRKEDAALRENERRFEVAVTRHFAEQWSAVAKALGMTEKAETDALAALDGMLLPDGSFDPEKWAALTELEQQQLTEAIAAGLLNWREEAQKLTDVKWLAQGTIYPDVIESGAGDAAVIKSHHNVGGLPDCVDFKEIVEPLRLLFKDEVRQLGRELGLPEYLVARQPFPGPGLAIRVIGEITRDKLDTLREADAIFREELARAGEDKRLSQFFAALTNMRSVGVMGDGRTYDWAIALRAVTTDDFMTADWARIPYELLDRVSVRIVNEVPHVNRIVYDITSKPPATVEWE